MHALERRALDVVPPCAAPVPVGRRLVATATPGDGTLLRWYAGDWRSILEGTSIGLLQLMYPPLGTAVASQSGFFDDPYGRIFRSIPQIWATILAPDADRRARHIRDLHRDIRGVAGGRRFSALEPETFWWAHATFTHLILRSVERYHRAGELDAAGLEHLYADTVAWYERYGVSSKPVPATLDEFRTAFDRFCAERLEVTEAVERTLAFGRERGPAVAGGTPVDRVLGSVLRRTSTLSTFGNLPPVVRERMGIEWTGDDDVAHDRLVTAFRWTFEAMPPAVNRRTFTQWLRRTGSRTRPERYVPAGRAA